MKSSPTTPDLFSVVSSYKKLSIEDYQRTYSWEARQIEDFFEDLKDATSTGETHFFGTLILQENEKSRDEATVVDGQQRLTTAFILVAGFRDAIGDLATQIIDSQKANMRPINVMEKAWNFLCPTENLDEHRFVSSRYLRELMETSVLSEPSKRKPLPQRDRAVTLAFRKGVRQIRDLIREDLTDFPSDLEKLQRVNALIDTLCERFLVLRVTTNSLSESLDIFLTLNNRGLPLGPSDLVRGELMSVRGQGKTLEEQVKIQKTILEEWQLIVDNVNEPESFLRHYLVSTSDEKVQKKKVVPTVVKRIYDADLDRRQKNAEAFWDDLMLASTFYGQVINPTMGGECQYHLELLDGLSKSHRIILLAVLRAGYEDSERDEITRLVFVLAFRWTMAGLNAQRLEDYFQSLCGFIRQGEAPSTLLDSLSSAVIGIDLNVKKYFSIDADSSYATRALLHAVNKATTKGSISIQLDNKKLHLEHIAPQSESDEWIQDLFGKDQTRYANYESVIGAAGNLTLLDVGLNLQAQKKPFSAKKVEYKKSTMDIARDLLEFEVWDANMIEQRTDWLVEMFEQIWNPKPGKPKIVSFTDWFESR